MAFYKSKFTGQEIDARLTQGTYDDAVKAGFKGTKEEFYALLGQLQETTDAAIISQPAESDKLETFNKNIVDAINELHQELQAKPDEQDVIDQGELEVFKDEIAAKYATKGEIEGDIKDINSKISTLNNNLVESVNTINKNVNDSLTIVNEAIQQNAETLVAEINQRKEADKDLSNEFKEGDANLQKNIETVNQNLVQSINQINENVANGFNTINGAINDEIRPNIENNKTNITQLQETVAILNTNLYESIETINTAFNNAINTINGGIATEIADRQNADTELDAKITQEISDRTAAIVSLDSTLRNEIAQRKNADVTLDSMIRQEISNRQTADDQLSERIETLENAGYQNAEQVKAEIEKVIDFAPEALDTLKEISEALNNDPNFATTITEEVSKKLDSDKLISGAGIDISEEDNKKIINISNDALTKIQYADSEVRRLENDKISYAYDEKTQSNINVILPEGGSYLGNYGDENATIAKAAVYDGTKQLEIGSSKVHTNINTDSNVTIETSTGKKTIATTDELVNVVNIPIRSLQDKIYTQEEILNWFGVTNVPELKQKISSGSQMYLRYGILLSGNPMYYKMPIEYTAFESANQIKLVLVGLNTRDDVTSKYEILINLDETIIEGNSNVKLTLLSLEPDLSQYALKSEIPDISNFATKSELNTKQDTLVSGTNIRTLNGASLLGEGNIQLNEGTTNYTDLTNKPSINNVTLSGNLSFEDLGLDINTTWDQIQNKPDFATVATSGDYNDLTNSPDLTVYQTIADDSLTTSSKTIPGAINEIKASVDSISDPYEINLTNLLSAEDSESISTAIGGIDNLNATVQDNRLIVGTISNGSVSVSIRILGNVTTLYYLLDSVVGLTLNEIAITNTSGTLSKSVTTHSVLTENMVINSLNSDETTLPLSAAQGKVLATDKQDKLKAGTGIEITPENTINVTLDTTVFKVVASLPESPAAGDENKIHLVPAESTEEGNIYTEYVFVNGKWEEFGTYRSEVDLTLYLKKTDAESTYQKITDNTLATIAKTVVGAINENTGNVTRIDRAVGNPTVNAIVPTAIRTNFAISIKGIISSANGYNIYSPIDVNKGDTIVLYSTASKDVSIITSIEPGSEPDNLKVINTLLPGGRADYRYVWTAPEDMTVVLCSGEYGRVLFKDVFLIKSSQGVNLADNSYMQYLHKMYEEYGAVYNKETGYWEYGDLKDMTEEDCFLAAFYALDAVVTADTASKLEGFNGALTNRVYRSKSRTFFTKNIGTSTFSGSTFCISTCFAHNDSLEYIKLFSRNGIRIRSCGAAFYRCLSLRTIDTIFIVDSLLANFQNAFFQCYKLKTIKIQGLRSPVSFQDSPLLSYESLNYLVTNAANTAAITVTVHPTTYSYLTGTAQPTEEVGGATEEWQALVTTAQSKQISFAVPEETQSEVTE